MSDKVKVAIRLRPLNRRELDLSTKIVVDTTDNQTILYHPSQGFSKDGGDSHGSRKPPKIFAFDHCFWSMDEANPKFSGQEKVFACLGEDILERAFEGYNACIFAYGQTGSGKSFTMMGSREHKGLIPRLCDTLFDKIDDVEKNDDVSCKVEVSYMEIYNEKVHDLLDFKGGKQHLRVREHNILGPYVDGLSQLVVAGYEDIDNLMSEGNKSRTVAATNMNNESSRSHAVFNIILTQTLTDKATSVSGEKVSKVSLVDLAGSERAVKTGAVGERLKEGSNINKSLTTLGLVISALADQASGTGTNKNKLKFVPYRDSVLTWLLKDNLGGNSKTVMVATLSPAADNYEETLSTLRYADRAKRIVNHAVVNEDPNARIIRELREEVETLKLQLDKAQSKQTYELEERLEETEKLFRDMTKTWEEKLAETERIHTERHQALEKMGISVQTSGIKVEQDKCFLVNLNADPSLNELLVYYLKPDLTLVGRPDAPTKQDIQLSGLGILPEHCVLESAGNDVYLTPFEGARTCVNGSLVKGRTRVKHADRILWGNNHFFRLNCPKANSPLTNDPQQTKDYDYAQQEVMKMEMPDDPIQEAINAMEKQQEDDKQEALDKQRQMYERQMQMLRSQLMSPSTPSNPFVPFPPFDLSKTSPGSKMHNKYQQWAHEREKLFKQSLVKLKEEVVKANSLVRGANILAQEMGKKTEFSVTLQIPAANLSPNRKRGAFVSEPAILVKRKDRASQVWSMEKFENKIIDMREMYEERKEKGLPMMDEGPPQKGDPFYESQENHNLIGVANVFLECLFYDVKLDYHVPIISQQGEVSGRLHVQVTRIAGRMPDRTADAGSENGLETRSNYDYMDDEGMSVGNHIVCEICIKEAKGLPPALANFVFCQYSFWGHPDPMVVPPVVDPNVKVNAKGARFGFDHRREFKVYVTEEFIEHASDGALSIEVWGHRNTGFGYNKGWELETVQAKSRSILDRWGELIRKIELWVEIHELNEQGDYVPVEVVTKPEASTGGTFQLRQGHSRRLLVYVNPVQNSGTLPIICEAITSLSVGCVCARSKLQKGLDSYQEEDLNTLREKWSDALTRRRQYLDEQIKKIMDKSEKNDADNERERSLIDQWVCLTEERNAVLVPAAGSAIPGAPADWTPPAGMEQHIPVIFLDLNADDMTTPNAKEGLQAAGINSILPKEHGAKFFNLPIVKYSEKEVCAIASWDSSIHDSINLNRVTPAQERVYMILKAVVRLSHPASMELVLRKRLCINVYKKQSLTDKLKKRMSRADQLTACAVTYDIVSNIPKASEDLEDRESLAQMAASTQNDEVPLDGETYIEKYIKGVSAVESILTLDKLRQEVAVKELLAAQGRPLRKTASVPNIHGIFRSDSFCRGLEEQIRSESVMDLSLISDSLIRSRDGMNSPGNYNQASPLNNLVSPQPAKFVTPMRTLVEEQHVRETKPLLRQESDSGDEFSDLATRLDDTDNAEDVDNDKSHHNSASDDEFQEFECYKPSNHLNSPPKHPALENLAHSSTNDSLVDIQVANKSFTPSMTSSGYGSQAVSTLTLSSEDSNSVRSMSIDEPPDVQREKSRHHEINRQLEASGLERASPVSLDLLESDSKTSTDSDTPSLIDTKLPFGDALALPLQPIALENGDAGDPDDADDDRGDTPVARENGPIVEVYDFDALELELQTTTEVSNNQSQSTTLASQSVSVTDPKSEVTTDHNLASLVSDNAATNDGATGVAVKSSQLDSDTSVEAFPVEAMPVEAMPVEAMPVNNVVRRDYAKSLAIIGTQDNRKSLNLDPRARRQQTSEKRRSVPEHKLNKMSQMMGGRTSGGAHGSRDNLSVSAKKAELAESYDSDFSSSVPSLDGAMENEELGVLSGREVESPEGYHSDGDDGMSICSFGSRADLDRLHNTPTPSWIQLGEPCLVSSSTGVAPAKAGWVRFIGTTEFAPGQWIGVECELAEGKNDGSVRGVRYFKCRARHGLFVRHDKLSLDRKRRRSPQTANTLKTAANPAANSAANAATQRKPVSAQPPANAQPKKTTNSIKKK